MVSWRIATDNDQDQIYLTMIFRSPQIRAFSWYEINVPAQLICEQRRGGTTAKQYI
ncbi:hypothetical protein [Dyadobacter sp. 3J3]|uniref:hypothetical protein n=1 Tax=Dyadobacter sp. 3J3 TaxID=2606600 RepID=UPI00135A1DB4|nr:hypothetical protein [Dyadobacter sp. 3J3]